MCFWGWEVFPRAGPVLLHLVDQVEGSLGWMGQQHPLRAAPSKGTLQREAPWFSFYEGVGTGQCGQGQLPQASYMGLSS